MKFRENSKSLRILQSLPQYEAIYMKKFVISFFWSSQVKPCVCNFGLNISQNIEFVGCYCRRRRCVTVNPLSNKLYKIQSYTLTQRQVEKVRIEKKKQSASKIIIKIFMKKVYFYCMVFSTPFILRLWWHLKSFIISSWLKGILTRK